MECHSDAMVDDVFFDYVIIDDDSDMTPDQLEKHFVKTDNRKGITWKDAKKAVKILNGEKK